MFALLDLNGKFLSAIDATSDQLQRGSLPALVCPRDRLVATEALSALARRLMDEADKDPIPPESFVVRTLPSLDGLRVTLVACREPTCILADVRTFPGGLLDLTPRQREILLLMLGDDLEVKQAARRMGITQNTARTLLVRARGKAGVESLRGLLRVAAAAISSSSTSSSL